VGRRTVLQLIVVGALAGAFATAVALLIPWLGDPASREGERIDQLFWFTIWICVAVFAVVAAVLVVALLNFRVPLDDDRDGPPIHGNTKLEIIWTAVPAVLVTAISVFSAIVLAENGKASSPNPLHVNVYAQQFAWTFEYPEFKNVKLPTLFLEKGRSVKLTMRSRDVIHSFWVPEFRQKQDLLPDQDTTIWITPTKTGVFPVICTELCGLGHAAMRTQAQVFATPALFAAAMRKAANPPQQSGLQIFNAQGCAGCHTLTAAKATQKIGPNLDNLAGDAKRAGKPLAEFIHESIVSPAAYIEKSCADAMPKNYQELIPSAQLDALVAFLAKSGTKTEPRGCGE